LIPVSQTTFIAFHKLPENRACRPLDASKLFTLFREKSDACFLELKMSIFKIAFIFGIIGFSYILYNLVHLWLSVENKEKNKDEEAQ